MEILKLIKRDIQICKEELVRKKKLRSLERFFQTSGGRVYLQNLREEWHVAPNEKGRIAAIDNDFQEFRLVVPVENDVFVDILRRRRPKILKYRVTFQDDSTQAGDLLAEITDKVAVKTSGSLFPQTSGVESIFWKMQDIRLTQVNNEYSGFRPWKELSIDEPPAT